jgi:kynurenine 3-monooxygenase
MSKLVGSVLACFLAKRGHQVTVYERRADMRTAGYIGGRSINLALSNRGWATLDKLGMRAQIAPMAIPMTGRMVHNIDGTTLYVPYGKDGQAIYSISRGDLNIALINEAEKYPNVQFIFNQRCDHADFETSTVRFIDTTTHETTVAKGDVVFGSDGAFSEIRMTMQRRPGFDYSQVHESHGYKELSMPAAADGGSRIERHALHIWPRKSFMMIALPNLDGSFTCTLFAPFKGQNSFESVQTEADIQAYFQTHFASALPHFPNLITEYTHNPTSYLITTKCYPWVVNQTALIGDSAHAIVPFYGQGMNCGFEDVRELDEILETAGEDWTAALQKYQTQRKPNADAIADLAQYNFIEMRDLAGQPEFQLRLKIEKRIAAAFPDKFNTLYSMVTFDQTPYALAQRQAAKQGKLLDVIMQLDGITDIWESDTILQMADKWIKENV